MLNAFHRAYFALGGQLEKLMDDLHSELSNNPPLPGSYTARKGDLCAALFVDSNWYVTETFVDSVNREETYSFRSFPPPPPPFILHPVRLLYPLHPTRLGVSLL